MRHALSRDADIALVPGGAVLRIRGRSVAFEAGEGMAAGLQPDDLRALDGLLVSSGAMADIAGLLPLLHARAAYPGELTLVHPLGDERVGALLEAWDRGFPGRLQVSDDAVHPDTTIALAGLRIEVVGLPRAEVVPGEPPRLASLPAVGWRVRGQGFTVAWARAPAPSRALDALLRGADLAVVSVGTTAVPGLEGRWRLRPDEAARFAPAVRALWVVDEAGALLGGDAH